MGGFDGMHIAHQRLFSHLGHSGAVLVIDNGYANITPKDYRQKFSIHKIYYENLKDIKNLSGLEFIQKLKQKFKSLQTIVVGYDFRFGAGATCGIDKLKKYFKKVVVVDEISYDNIPIHSRTIREFIKNGNTASANNMLGRHYEIAGHVISGQGIGTKQLVPTINISCVDFVLPKAGVYKTATTIDKKQFNSVTFVGVRATTDGKKAIETHIINQDLKTVSKHIVISFISYLRQNKKFENLKSLNKQIQTDIKNCQTLS
jgi:riboflavin kinase/FMN adenylyltransferase